MRGSEQEWAEILDIIKSTARRRYGWLDVDELVSVASLEAVKASARWNPATGCSMKNFLLIRARGAMQDYLKLHESLKRGQMPKRVAVPGSLHDAVSARIELNKGLQILTPIERDCLLRFWWGNTTIEIAQRLHVCQSRVSQHLMSARGAIRERLAR